MPKLKRGCRRRSKIALGISLFFLIMAILFIWFALYFGTMIFMLIVSVVFFIVWIFWRASCVIRP